MKTNGEWRLGPALVGLGSLLVYILACTSFSPDDSKVLYPTFDPKSGTTAVAVYDRTTAKSEILFEPQASGINQKAKAVLLRPQWVQNGHGFLAIWDSSTNAGRSSCSVAFVPFGRAGTPRIFPLPEDCSSEVYLYPLPVVGNFLFLTDGSNLITRLNYQTGETLRKTNEFENALLPSPGDDRVFYLTDDHKSNGSFEIGVMDPATLAQTALFRVADENISGQSITFSRDARILAYQSENESPLMIHLLETGKPARVLVLTTLDGWVGGWKIRLREFSPTGDVLYASVSHTNAETTNTECGFLEIPLDGSQVRKTLLLTNISGGDKSDLGNFEVDLSHDGKTLAADSFWLVGENPSTKPEDCGLFLVDLTSPGRKATKVLIPLIPKERK